MANVLASLKEAFLPRPDAPTDVRYGLIFKASRDLKEAKGVGLFDKTSDQRWPLGSKLELGDRTFRYFKCGATATVAGCLYESAAHGGGYSTIEGAAVAADTKAGGTTITITLPNTHANDNVTLNEFKDGYITIAAATLTADGKGQTFKIKSHPAAARNASCVFTLYDKVPVEIDSSESCTASVVKNVYDSVIISPAGAMTGKSVGVPLVVHTASYYGWIQSKGPVGVLLDGDVTAGAPVVADASVAGAVTTQVVNAGYLLSPTVGHAISDADSGEFALIDLCID
jgi:hypothetical protein